MIRAYNLTTEHLCNPLGIDAGRPRLSWKIESDRNGTLQTIWKVQSSHTEDFASILWDGGCIKSDQSLYNRYAGPELESGERIYWRVKVWSETEESDYSEPAYFEMGLLKADDWEAEWIEPEETVDYDKFKPANYLRGSFEVGPELVQARAYLTARGVYYFYLNGQLGAEDMFNPGFTSYYTRLQVQTYDITGLLSEGENTWGVVLGDGWWRGSCGGGSIKNNFGYKVGFLGQLVLTYADGSKQVISSDDKFMATNRGPLRKTDTKGGEVYDARMEMDGWNCPGFDDSTWTAVHTLNEPKDMLIATRGVPMRCAETFTPTILITPGGETVLDFGQNIFGRMEMKVYGEAGTSVIMLHGESLDKYGNFSQKNIQQPKGIPPYEDPYQENTYILKGNTEENYVPLFSAHGFRYVQLIGYPGEAKPDNFLARAIYSACEDVGDFSCSSAELNQLVSNCRWTGKNNYVDVPTDCPTRERAAWLGDAQVFSRSAVNFMDVYAFFEKWTLDIKAEQYENGVCRNVAPTTSIYHNPEERKRKGAGFAYYSNSVANEPVKREGYVGWGDACVIIPWNMYICYGDSAILENMYETAKAWVEYERLSAMERNPYWKDAKWYQNSTGDDPDCNYIWDTKYHLGEWYESDFDIDTMGEFLARQHEKGEPILATAFFAYSVHLLSEMAHILGRKEDSKTYARLSARVKEAYNNVFVASDGTVQGTRHAASIRSLAFDLVYKENEQAVADKLNRMLIDSGYHFNSGFLSTGFLIPMLCRYNYTDTAFKILLQREMPSWLYEVEKGATTVWEIWAGVDADGEIEGSQCHFAPAAVSNSFFTIIGGINPVQEAPGFKHFLIKPTVGGGLTKAWAMFDSPYGRIVSAWKTDGTQTTYSITIPANTTANFVLPYSREVLERIRGLFPDAEHVDREIIISLGSGLYQISA